MNEKLLSAVGRTVRGKAIVSARRFHLAVQTAMAIALLTVCGAVSAASESAPSQRTAWVASWTASPQPLWDGSFALPIQLPFSLWQQTLRQTLRVSLGGSRLRVELSNAYGSRPLVIGAAHVALAGKGASIVAGSDRVLSFGGQPSVTLPPGAPVLSDPVDLHVGALSDVSVSLYFPEPTAPSTFHWDARQTGYVAADDQAGASLLSSGPTTSSRVALQAVWVEAAPGTHVVAAFGDSITDGAMSSMDRDARWPDALAARLAAQHVGVINAGISGARVLRDRMGLNALARLEQDVLAQPGVDRMIVLMGINDIGWHGTPLEPDAPIPAPEELIAGYRQLIAQAHARGVRILGATLTPFEGTLQDTPMKGYYSADKERVRQAVNQWIRHGGEFDAVVDFDAVVRDPAHPQRMLAAYDSGDHLHPGDAGYRAMAEAIDLSQLTGAP